MSSSIRALGMIVVACLAVFGLLSVFGIIPPETLPQSAGQIALGAAVVLAAILGFKLLSLGHRNLDKTEPPPQL